VFVSGLPPTLTNDQLKKHFETRFHVTDAHVLPKRRIGFVGFKSSEAAQQAVSYFNKTYMRMSKISVDIAKPVCHSSLCLICTSFFPLSLLTSQGGLVTDQ
jgi:multiple RNA-binding domain-containing protein 1